MKKSMIVSTLVFILAVTTVGTVLAVTNGQEDGDNHPYVGLLVFDYAEGSPGWRCSGTLIAPKVVLTAGHCTTGAVRARIWFDKDVTFDNYDFPLYPYGGPDSGSVEGMPHTNPDFESPENPYGNNGLPAFSYRDVGVVVLDEAVDMDEYALLPHAGLVDELANGTDVDYVGYGAQEKIPGGGMPPSYQWVGERIRMYAPGRKVSGNFVHSAEYMKLSLNPGGGTGGFCFGDSGGPDLLGGTDTVLAVNSYMSNDNCTGVAYSARVDIPEVLGWIESYMYMD